MEHLFVQQCRLQLIVRSNSTAVNTDLSSNGNMVV